MTREGYCLAFVLIGWSLLRGLPSESLANPDNKSQGERSGVLSNPPEAKKEDPPAASQKAGRDPFHPVVVTPVKETIKEKSVRGKTPLQKRKLSELKLIGVVHGEFGYRAMIQTPDGKGYAIHKGTRLGLNNAVVKKIDGKGLLLEEAYIDKSGKTKVRNIIMALHSRNGRGK